MSLRILHPTRTAGKAQTFFAPTNRTLSRPLLNARNFAFYRRSIREADVAGSRSSGPCYRYHLGAYGG